MLFYYFAFGLRVPNGKINCQCHYKEAPLTRVKLVARFADHKTSRVYQIFEINMENNIFTRLCNANEGNVFIGLYLFVCMYVCLFVYRTV